MGTVSLLGEGDDVVILAEPLEEFAALQVDGNSSSRYFGLKPVYLDGEAGSSLVNTTDPFVGTVLLEGDADNPLAGFEVKAIGGWSLTVVSINEVPKVESGETFVGSGNDLLRIPEAAGLTTLDVFANAESRYFGLRPHGASSGSFN